MHPLYQDIQSSLSSLLTYEGSGYRPSCLVIGFSGGVDSTVLLHALSANVSAPPLHALYINHGLSAQADDWQMHCEQVAESLGVTFHSVKVSVLKEARSSLEAQARDARYATLLAYCRQHNGALILGQHQDDQLETFLLQAKRGAGPKGLSSMPASSWRDGVLVCRPMLRVARHTIAQTARAMKLAWIEDDSNQDNQFDRNFLRNTVIPALTARWPALSKTVSRSAELCAQQQSLLDEVVDEKLAPLSTCTTLDIPLLLAYSSPWQLQLLRRWLEQAGLAIPGREQIKEIQSAATARKDAQPEVRLGDWYIRRMAETLYLVKSLAQPPTEAVTVDASVYYHFDWSASPAFCVSHPASVKANMPAVRCRIDETGVSKPLKNWMKQWGIPAWERKHLPVVFVGEVPVAVLTAENVIYFCAKPEDFSITTAH